MLTAAAQKEYTIVYFTQSKIEITIFLVSLYRTSQSNLSVFLKGKNLIKGLMSDLAMFDCFCDIICTREVPYEKNKRRQKCGIVEKLFIIKLVYCFKLMTVSN